MMTTCDAFKQYDLEARIVAIERLLDMAKPNSTLAGLWELQEELNAARQDLARI